MSFANNPHIRCVAVRHSLSPYVGTVEDRERKNGNRPGFWAAGLAIGIVIGIGIGVALHNVGVGVAIGVALGVALGAGFTSRGRGTP